MTYRACSGPCDQGRKPCPTREACRWPDADESFEYTFATALIRTAVILCLMAVAASIFY